MTRSLGGLAGPTGRGGRLGPWCPWMRRRAVATAWREPSQCGI